MVCTCSQCTASDYAEPQDDSWLDERPAVITMPKQDRERLMTALRGIEANMPRPTSYSDALTEYERRQGLSLADWLAENMKQREAK